MDSFQTTCKQFIIQPFNLAQGSSMEEILLEGKNQCAIVWIHRGVVKWTSAGQSHAIQAETVYLFDPAHSGKIVLSDMCAGYVITASPQWLYIPESGFNLSLFGERYNLYGGPLILNLDADTLHQTHGVLAQIVKLMSPGFTDHLDLVRQLFRIFLLYLIQKLPVGDAPNEWVREYQLVKEFMKILTVTSNKRMVYEYASQLNISPGYLNQIVKRVSGFTASYHIQKRLIEEAKKRVMSTGSSMKEVAYSLGFDDTAHFSKFFKANAGTNFTTFRKALAG